MNVFIHEAGGIRTSHGPPFVAIPCTVGFFPLKLRNNMGQVTNADPNRVDGNQTLIVSGWVRPRDCTREVWLDVFDTDASLMKITLPVTIPEVPVKLMVSGDGKWTLEFPPGTFRPGETYILFVSFDGCIPASITFTMAP